MIAPRRGLAPALLACLCGVSCAEAPPPPPAARVEPKAAPSVTVAPPLPARWVESGGATLIGPELPGGTLVLLGGRRALVLADGALTVEKTAAPEPLQEIVAVPTNSGPRLVGRGQHGIYRFDEPLGAPALLAQSEQRIERLGAGPGAVAVWTERSDLPRFLDVESGSERAFAGLPAPPLHALSFLDERRGAGVFEVVGLAATTDGGATWRPVTASAPRDALAVDGLRRRGDAIRAYTYAEGPDAAIDLDAARLGPMEPPSAGAREAALLRWIRASARDPLEAAASGGIDLGGGAALIASHGMIARVDLRTGAIGELVEVAHGKWVPCSAGRAGRAAWVACTLPDGQGADVFDPFGVIRVPLDGPHLAPEKPALVRNGEAELRVSPSGGALLTAPCTSEESGQACVRQPDGRWRSVNPDVELTERGTGALADGRVAFLRGLFDGDDGPEPAAGAADEEAARSKRLHVAVLGPDGKEHALAPIAFTPSRGYVRVESPIEEDVDHALRFVIEDGEGPFVVTVPAGHETPSAVRIPDAAEARLRAGHGIAAGEGHLLASLDGGATWNEVPASRATLDAAGSAGMYEGESTLAVSEVGARVGPMLRLGWGQPDGATAPADPPPLVPKSTLPAPQGAPRSPELALSCTSSGAGTGLPALLGSAEVRQLLGKPAAKAGTKHDTSVWAARINALETVALLDEESPDKRGAAPATWTFRWHDPREIGGKVRTVSVKAPAGAAVGTSLRFAAADGARAIFAVRSGGKMRLVRVKGTTAEVIEVPQELIPAGEVVFGEGRGEPIAWLHESSVIAWLAGEKPRAVALVAAHGARALGTPSAAGIPMLVGGSDWALARTLPIPALDKASIDKPPPPAPATLDGWTRLVPVRQSVASLPVCNAGKAKGARFVIEKNSLRADLDGVSQSATTAVYTVRVAGSEACVEALAATLTPTRRGAPKTAQPAKPGPKGKPGHAPSAPLGASFVRVDLTGKKAEGGERGVADGAHVRRMTCALGSGAAK
jgi:hypothetical protein